MRMGVGVGNTTPYIFFFTDNSHHAARPGYLIVSIMHKANLSRSHHSLVRSGMNTNDKDHAKVSCESIDVPLGHHRSTRISEVPVYSILLSSITEAGLALQKGS